MTKDFLMYVRQIVDETREDLFPEVKVELKSWLVERSADEKQLKALDLLERFVHDARTGYYREPVEILNNFTREPEFN